MWYDTIRYNLQGHSFTAHGMYYSEDIQVHELRMHRGGDCHVEPLHYAIRGEDIVNLSVSFPVDEKEIGVRCMGWGKGT